MLRLALLMVVPSLVLCCPSKCQCDSKGIVTCTKLDKIPTFPPETTQIVIRTSKVNSVPSNAFVNLPKIRTIEITDSEVRQIQSCAFSRLATIESIDIQRCSITDVQSRSFSHLTSIQNISFNSVQIKNIKPLAFYDLSGIKTISLTYATIQKIAKDAFKNIQDVNAFHLKNTTISSVESFAFNSFQNIHDFVISYGTIEAMGASAFYSLMNIGSFQFDHLEIHSLGSEGVWGPFNTIGTGGNSSFAHNKVQSAHCSLFSGFSDAASWNVNDNVITCDCSTAWLFLNLQEHEGHYNNNTCGWPAPMVNMTFGELEKSDLCPDNSTAWSNRCTKNSYHVNVNPTACPAPDYPLVTSAAETHVLKVSIIALIVISTFPLFVN